MYRTAPEKKRVKVTKSLTLAEVEQIVCAYLLNKAEIPKDLVQERQVFVHDPRAGATNPKWSDMRDRRLLEYQWEQDLPKDEKAD